MSREVHVPFYERLGVQFPQPTHRFGLSFRDAEDFLAERRVTVSYEAIRQWYRVSLRTLPVAPYALRSGRLVGGPAR